LSHQLNLPQAPQEIQENTGKQRINIIFDEKVVEENDGDEDCRQ